MSTGSQIPRIDISGFLAGDPEGTERAALELRDALTRIGFFFIEGHGVSWDIVDNAYEQARRFHAIEQERKEAIRMGPGKRGYMPSYGEVSASSEVDESDIRKPNRVESFFVNREGSDRNQWPDDLPGFREGVSRYYDTIESLAQRLLPLYAASLGLAPDYFAAAFAEPTEGLRISHYAPAPHDDPDEWGLSAHTDRSFMTLLPANRVAGLWIRPEEMEWMRAPYVPESFIINSGDTLRRWTNDVYLSTAHRVENPAVDRYAIPYFYSPSSDTLLAPIETCVSEENPPRHEPITAGEYDRQFLVANYGTADLIS